MVDPSASDSQTTSGRSGRGPTRLRSLSLRRASGEKTPLDIDVHTGIASGPHAQSFSSYLGVLAREKFCILKSWDEVTEVERNLIWQDILVRHPVTVCFFFVN